MGDTASFVLEEYIEIRGFAYANRSFFAWERDIHAIKKIPPSELLRCTQLPQFGKHSESDANDICP